MSDTLSKHYSIIEKCIEKCKDDTQTLTEIENILQTKKEEQKELLESFIKDRCVEYAFDLISSSKLAPTDDKKAEEDEKVEQLKNRIKMIKEKSKKKNETDNDR